ncbi:hypothetical protein [Nocardioides sp. cx-173]|uniref:hypothetical protein n=1 Tax=Nocardioides sp. cx-173 TaxID=2898796 RepID=UPI001E391489|nr:hypothetical protein [Nocardioides sp. cx-173]MCD4524404.1 hypothetical protein [Nocardioides sp. cx-173]UGB43108.1 hypothetical protein LQ940_06175 [Nocardioides sp. cx-173]
MTVLDLDAPDLEWREHQIAGAEKPARMVLLHADAERGTRTVMVQFPDGWRRDAVGHQPAGEEMVLLSGALSISGHTAALGDLLVVEPRATRSATSVADGTRALVWFSGPGGGWTDGPAADAGTARVAPLAVGEQRAAHDELVGTLSVHDDLPEQSFDADVDVLWLDERSWLHAPAGTTVPARPGRAVVRHYG